MKKALIILDVQRGFVSDKDQNQLQIIENLIGIFKKNRWPVIAFQHVDSHPQSPIQKGTHGAEIVDFVKENSDLIIEKKYPIAYKETKLQKILQHHEVEEIYIVGFNMEFCVLFTAIASADRGYKVTVVEDGCGTVNDNQTYEMEGLDIVDFVGSVLDWSEVIKDVYYEELEF